MFYVLSPSPFKWVFNLWQFAHNKSTSSFSIGHCASNKACGSSLKFAGFIVLPLYMNFVFGSRWSKSNPHSSPLLTSRLHFEFEQHPRLCFSAFIIEPFLSTHDRFWILPLSRSRCCVANRWWNLHNGLHFFSSACNAATPRDFFSSSSCCYNVLLFRLNDPLRWAKNCVCNSDRSCIWHTDAFSANHPIPFDILLFFVSVF